MKIVITTNTDGVGAHAGSRVAELVHHTPDAVIGLATGTSPLGLYSWLADEVASNRLDFSRTQGFALDEYVGIPLHHPESYAAVLQRHVAEPLRIPAEQIRVPNGRADDLEQACNDYESAIIAAGGIDLQILGIGSNGHIGFNEPPATRHSTTRPVELSSETRNANARFFNAVNEVPTHALTQGIATILRARKIVLVAHGAKKSHAIAAAIRGPISAACPASFLQLHPDVSIVVDKTAASLLHANS
jgi:glucosamine-6-phosphate deaminase